MLAEAEQGRQGSSLDTGFTVGLENWAIAGLPKRLGEGVSETLTCELRLGESGEAKGTDKGYLRTRGHRGRRSFMTRRKTSGLEPTSTDIDNSNTCGRKLEARPAPCHCQGCRWWGFS